MNYFVTAIGTDSGKTLVSAILCKALKADYWKPVQAGEPKDADTVRALVDRSDFVVHPERYALKTPASPHAAAKVEGVRIQLSDFTLPPTKRDLVIEGAGGCLVPLNDSFFVIDLALKFRTPVILVSNLYLGSINHTLLTVEALKSRGAEVRGIIFNGPPNEESERIILHHSNYPCLLRIKQEHTLDAGTISTYANALYENWNA